MYLKQGRGSDAEFVADKVVSHESLSKGPTSSECIKASNSLSFIYTAQGKYERSLEIHTKILDQLELTGSSSALARIIYEQLNLKGRALERLGRWREAEMFYDQLEAEIARSWAQTSPEMIERKLWNILQ